MLTADDILFLMRLLDDEAARRGSRYGRAAGVYHVLERMLESMGE